MPVDPWGVKSVQPVAPVDPWGVASVAPIPSAQSVSTPSPQPGFLKSFADASGLSTLGNAVMHPRDTFNAINDLPNPNGVIATGVKNEGQRIAGQVGQAYDSLKSGNYAGVASHGIAAIPVLGPAMDTAADYAADNGAGKPGNSYGQDLKKVASSPSAMGTLFGTASNVVTPKLLDAGLSAAGRAAQGAGFVGKLASATPEAQKIAATRALVPGAPSEMLSRALKPPVTMPEFEQSVEQSLPSIAAQNPQGVSGFAQAAQTSKNATNDFYQNLKAPHVDSPVDASPIYNAQINSIPITNQIENGPKIFDSTEAKALNYKQPLPLGILDDVRQDTNAKLDAFYNKTGGDRNAALSDPETARTKATNDTSRDLVYSNLSRLAGIPEEDIRANQNLFGSLSDVAQVAGKRATVAGRANPMSLQETLALKPSPMGVVDYAGQRLFKGVTNSDALTNAALDRYRNPDALFLPPRPSIPSRVASSIGSHSINTGDALRSFKAPPSSGFLLAPTSKKKRGLFD